MFERIVSFDKEKRIVDIVEFLMTSNDSKNNKQRNFWLNQMFKSEFAISRIEITRKEQ